MSHTENGKVVCQSFIYGGNTSRHGVKDILVSSQLVTARKGRENSHSDTGHTPKKSRKPLTRKNPTEGSSQNQNFWRHSTLLILIREILLILMWRGANDTAEQRDKKTDKAAASISITALNCVIVTRAQCINSYVRFACVRYTKYFLEIVSKVYVKYFLFIMKYYEKYMMQANSKSSCFTSAISEGSVILEKWGRR